MTSRREFLALSAAAILAGCKSWAVEKAGNVPSTLDHVILGCSNLDLGIALVEERTGVRAAIGGIHPDRGTMNALASLGDRHYLEIMAPNPDAKNVQAWAVPRLNRLKELTSPRLVTWAVHPPDIESLGKKLRDAGIALSGLQPGSRVRPDGRVLKWKSLNLADDHNGLLPFFIEWSADSIHPSSDAPSGMKIERFVASDPNPAELSRMLERMGVELLVEQGERSQLRARFSGPKGILDVNS